ncbi:MAG: hypothetical protein R3F21_10655 [Myxococcota bacterium]
MPDAESRHALVFALAHEVGNHLAGIRLEAHLLDESLGAAALARASVAIDSLAGQAGPWLALLRPLLAPEPARTARVSVASVLDGVRRQLEEDGLGGRAVHVEIASDAAEERIAFDGLHALLMVLVGSPETLPPGRAPIALRLASCAGAGAVAGAGGGEVEVVCELPGEAFGADAGDGAGGQPALRGRDLAVALARVLVADAGGGVDVESGDGCARVRLRLPRG